MMPIWLFFVVKSNHLTPKSLVGVLLTPWHEITYDITFPHQVNALDGYNRTALHYAAEKDESCVELLLEYGAQPNALDGNKDTPLHWAAFKDNPECVRALLESGACPNSRDYNNDTPLSWAAMKGNLESVKVLLDYGAQVHVTNLKGQTPISRLVALLARGLGTDQEEECLELLCRAAGRFEIRRADGTLPRELSKDPQLLARLTNMVAQAPTLRSLARCAVRQSLGVQFLPTAVKELPLPETIKDYLLLRDWGDETTRDHQTTLVIRQFITAFIGKEMSPLNYRILSESSPHQSNPLAVKYHFVHQERYTHLSKSFFFFLILSGCTTSKMSSDEW